MATWARYRTRPNVKEAVRWEPELSLAAPFRGIDSYGVEWTNEGQGITTLEGFMRVSPGDWIIKGLRGEFYPCKPDIFEKSYERVEE